MLWFYLVSAIIICVLLFSSIRATKNSKRIWFLMTATLIGYLMSLENRAAYCGVAFSYPQIPPMPYRVKSEWMGGAIWFEDVDGFGVLTPHLGLFPKDPRLASSPEHLISTQKWGDVRVDRISAYTYDSTRIYVKLATTNAQVQYAVIDQANPTREKVKLFSESEFSAYLGGFRSDDLSWLLVGAKDCGDVNFKRFVVYFIIFIISLYGLFSYISHSKLARAHKAVTSPVKRTDQK